MYQYYFEKLEIWQIAREYVNTSYKYTSKFPPEEKYGLGNQIQRAAVSVPSNIAEGVSRKNPREQQRFLEISFASLMETLSQWHNAKDLDYIDSDDMNNIRCSIDELSNKLNAFSRSVEQRIHPHS